MGCGEARQRRLPDPRPVRPRRSRAVEARFVPPVVGVRAREHAGGKFEKASGGTRRPSSTPTRCRTRATSRLYQKHWIGVVPMEAELHRDGHVACRASPPCTRHHRTGRAENGCFSGSRPLNRGLFHTGCNGSIHGKGVCIYGLTTSIMAVGEGNYGRLGPATSAATCTRSTRRCSTSPRPGTRRTRCPARCRRPSRHREQGANIDRCWTCRSMFMQAWGNYGTAWSVVHQWLGVDPDLGRHVLSVRPAGAAGPASGERQATSGSAAVRRACHRHAPRTRYRTVVDTDRGCRRAHGAPRRDAAAQREAGRACASTGTPRTATPVRRTNRGDEVVVRPRPARHTLVVTKAGPPAALIARAVRRTGDGPPASRRSVPARRWRPRCPRRCRRPWRATRGRCPCAASARTSRW